MAHRLFLKFIFTILCFLVFENNIFSQENVGKVDSLEAVLAKAADPKSKTEILTQLGKIYQFSNPPKAGTYWREQIRIASEHDLQLEKGKGYFMLAQSLWFLGKMDSTVFYIEKAENIGKKHAADGFKILEAKVSSLLGVLELQKGFPKQGLPFFEKAENILLALKSPEKNSVLSSLYTNRGIGLNKLNRNNEALESYKKAKKYAIEAKDKRLEATASSNIGALYIVLKDYEKALKIIREAIEIKESIGFDLGTIPDMDQIAIIYHQTDAPEAEEHLEKFYQKTLLSENGIYIAAALKRMGLYYIKEKDWDKAEASFLKLFEFESKYRFTELDKNNFRAWLSGIYNQKKEYRKALKYSEAAVASYDKEKIEQVSYIIPALTNLAQAQFETGNQRKAWNNQVKMVNMLRDSFENTQQTALADAIAQFEIKENRLALEKAETEKQLEVQKAAAARNTYLSLLGGAGLLLLLGFFYNRQIRKANQTIALQKTELESSLNEKEVLLKEVHHRVKNNLQVISGLLSKQARKSDDEEVKKMIREGRDRVYSMALVHQNLYQAENLSAINIKNYLEELTRNIAASQANENIEVELKVDDSKLDIDVAIPVGLILNELISNAFKYAFPNQIGGKINIDFYKKAESFFLRVSDNGIGLPEGFDFTQSKSLGLNLVKGLVRQLDGVFVFDNKQKGVAFEVNFDPAN